MIGTRLDASAAVPALTDLSKDREGLADAFRVAAAQHVLHEQRLKDEQAQRKAGDILNDDVQSHRQTEQCGHGSRQDDTGRVSRHAMDGAAHSLLPDGLDERLMRSRTRSLSVRT